MKLSSLINQTKSDQKDKTLADNLHTALYLDAAVDEVAFLRGELLTDDDSLSRLIGDEGSLSELSCFTTAALFIKLHVKL